ncbi:MAG: ABC transporter ATP-binding protein [Candidatus Bathyarchaeia archaeon]
MEENEPISPRGFQRPFIAEAAIVFLTVFVTTGLVSLVGWSPGITSHLPPPIDTSMELLIIVTSLLGVYGLFNGGVVGTYFALLAPIFEMVLVASSLLKTFNTPQHTPGLMIQEATAIALGILTFVCVLKTMTPPVRRAPMTVDGPSSTDLKTQHPPPNNYAIEVAGATKEYTIGPNVISAIDGLSMRVRNGEFVAIMGPSGSGKSTLLNLIGALDRPTHGRILIDGVDISTLDDPGLARLRNEKVGFVFQSYNLIDRSNVLRNMELPILVRGCPREERLGRIGHLLKTVGLGDKAPRKPQTLSGGEQQRVAIARALVNNPRLVLADEPTGNIDSRTGREVMGYLRKLSLENGTTVVVVTHDREVAEMADRIIQLRDGRIVGEEPVGGPSV